MTEQPASRGAANHDAANHDAANHDTANHDTDCQFMAQAIELARTNEGLTASNPSVGTLIVSYSSGDAEIVGRGVTAIGGRPHAEPQALAEAGSRARGATAYVTLEPCAHHGRTPPCADALVAAGIARVVGAATDPDHRVSGKGYDILRAAGIEVVEGVMAAEAAYGLAGYLTRRVKNRAHVTLKLAISANGKIGLRGNGQVAITGAEARDEVHRQRAIADIILVGSGTALADDPELTCRLPGLEHRSPIRLILDDGLKLPLKSKLIQTVRQAPLWIATSRPQSDLASHPLAETGAEFFAAEKIDGRLALPEMLEDIAARGLSTVYVEGGKVVAEAFLDESLVDRIILFTGPDVIEGEGVQSPITAATIPSDFIHLRSERFGADRMDIYERVG